MHEQEGAWRRLERPCFSVGSFVYTWRDAIAAGFAWGAWSEVESRTREGIACRRRLDLETQAPARDDLEAEQRRFRYRRRLLSADEARAWLERWGLSVAEWHEYLLRSLLRRQWADELAALVSEHAPPRQEIEALALVEAICSGELERLAEKLAGRAAAHAAVGGAVGDARDPKALEVSFGRFAETRVDGEAVVRELDAHRLEWMRFEVDELVFADAPMAREALLSLAEGRVLEDVARDAATSVRRTAFLLEEAEPSTAETLLAAREGDIVGPLERHGGHAVARIRSRLSPSADDSAILGRAEDAALQRALRREVVNRVRWHERG